MNNSVWFLERYGAEVIEPTAFEPDPKTHRNEYYYNAVTNALYQRVITRKEGSIIKHAYWQQVSN